MRRFIVLAGTEPTVWKPTVFANIVAGDLFYMIDESDPPDPIRRTRQAFRAMSEATWDPGGTQIVFGVPLIPITAVAPTEEDFGLWPGDDDGERVT